MRLYSMLLLIGTLLLSDSAGAEKPTIAGHWEGAIVIREAVFEVDLRIDIEQAADDSLKGTVSLPTQFVKDLPLQSVDFDGKKISFLSVDKDGVVSSFQGELSDGGRQIVGKMTEGGQSAPFHLARAAAKGPQTGQIQHLSADGKELISRFNQDAGSVRLLVVLSPTCGRCRMGALLIDRHILEKISDPRLRVYILWEKVNTQDSDAAARAAAALVEDERVTQLWSEDRFAGHLFQKTVRLETSPAWDIFLLFSGDKNWTGTPPQPDLYQHGLEGVLPKELELNASILAERIRSLLKS